MFRHSGGLYRCLSCGDPTLTHIVDQLSEKADLSVRLNRDELEKIMTSERQLTDGIAQSESNVDVAARLASTLDQFDLGFELLPGTGGQDPTPPVHDFTQLALVNSSGGQSGHA